MALDTDDFDAALDGLAATEVEEPPQVAPSTEPVAKSGPPALPRRPSASTGRVAFDDLFAAENTSPKATRGSPEEKITYFREKLKTAESQMARVREAWEARDREMDELETAVERERQRTEDAQQKQQKLKDFFDKKKIEFEDYSTKVGEAFAAKELDEKKLKAELDEIREQLTGNGAETGEELEEAKAELASMADLREALERDISLRDKGLAKLKKLVEEQRQSLVERDEQIELLSNEIATFDNALHDAKAREQGLESKLRDETSELNAEAELERESFAGIQESLQRDVVARNESIHKLESMLEEERSALKERDEQIEELTQQVEAAAKIALEESSVEQQLRAENEALALAASTSEGLDGEIEDLKRDLEKRDTFIAKLKKTATAYKRRVADRDDEIARLSSQPTADPAQEEEISSLRNAVAALQAELANAGSAGESAPRDEANIARLNKALALAARMLADLEIGNPTLFDSREATGEILNKLRKALVVAARVAEGV